jgi:hypothetical protein
MKTIFKGYGVFRKDRLCEHFDTKDDVKKALKVYNDCFKDKNTAIYPIEILRGEKIK